MAFDAQGGFLSFDHTTVDITPWTDAMQEILSNMSWPKRRAFLRKAARFMKKSVQYNFKVGGRINDVAGVWEPLKSSRTHRSSLVKNRKTGKSARRRLKADARPLMGRKKLINSIKIRLFGHEARIGTIMPVAQVHHFGARGTGQNKATIPPRPFMVFQPSDIRALMEYAHSFIDLHHFRIRA